MRAAIGKLTDNKERLLCPLSRPLINKRVTRNRRNRSFSPTLKQNNRRTSGSGRGNFKVGRDGGGYPPPNARRPCLEHDDGGQAVRGTILLMKKEYGRRSPSCTARSEKSATAWERTWRPAAAAEKYCYETRSETRIARVTTARNYRQTHDALTERRRVTDCRAASVSGCRAAAAATGRRRHIPL